MQVPILLMALEEKKYVKIIQYNRCRYPDKKTKTNTFGSNKEQPDRTDYGLSFGLVWKLNKFSVNMDYELSFPNLGYISEEYPFDYYKYRNRNVLLTIGYSFQYVSSMAILDISLVSKIEIVEQYT
ncbi:hypothetical protein [Xanthocytophaga agilis]|uniref:Uncharacterized protein n=1 Tax=Xanthocytophaga agilis TaxID=3048010 RepID=A0AAE3RDB2_9BACT|nr:hypothetical protein [Xanthocytophaga agilis]MDJ1505613.1 hypothetical protein [Xanthocytophaga agilis]